MRILIAYCTKEGQTEKISSHIAQILAKQGHKVTLQSGDELLENLDTDAYEAAIVGGSIHMNAYPRQLKKFASQYSDWLGSVPGAFFTVCMAINSPHDKEKADAEKFGVNFVRSVGWQPQLLATFAGAVKYTQYNFFVRFVMKRIAKHEGGDTDTSRDYEYTDWEKVAMFAKQFLSMIEEVEQKEISS